MNVLPLKDLNNSISEKNSSKNQNDDNQKITTKEMNNINSTMTTMINMMEDVEEIKKNLTMNLPSSSDQKNITEITTTTLSSPEVRGRALNFTNDINNASFTTSTEKPVNFVTNGPEIMTIFTNGGRAMVDLSDVSMDADTDIDFKAVLNKNDSLINVKEVTTTAPVTQPECVMNGKIYKVRI